MAQLMQMLFQASQRSQAAAATSGRARTLKITPERLAQAGVSFELARWYYCVGARLPRPTERDAICVSQVEFQVACAIP